ncbi:family 2 glycosyl transferase [Sulfurovum lithotrophicum]|uniref:Family 2 glycosyl transferase n=1 Tax=Sulfurovum lithotrophicum TaxID=206403 RepID=A0A7U4RRM4_9BACT|nr:glycosyltransferase family 2 protein [Sulfurovum lithotrophicum]AKF25916.1 family 2 glycosyl transferase [Sulfurovum lithotrophicum]
MDKKISVVMLTKNSSVYLEQVLNALKLFDEVIILDNGSSDNTVEIAQTYKNVRVHEHEFIGFGPMKQLAVSFARNDWILSIDSDEVLEEELIDEITSLPLNENNVYAIKRDNYYAGRLIRCCGWENDYVRRLFNREKVQFDSKQVHESLILNGIEVQKLRYPMKHYSFNNAEELISKMQHYSTLYAQENQKKKKSSTFKAFSRALFSFIKNYIFQKGFLYGYEGLLISVSNANGVFYKYIKLLEKNRK